MSSIGSYIEGEWLAIPLKNGSYTVGVVARVSQKRCECFGYFFERITNELPTIANVIHLKPEMAIYWVYFDNRKSQTDSLWISIGKAQDWNRANWPIPPRYGGGVTWTNEENFDEDLFTIPASSNIIKALLTPGMSFQNFPEYPRYLNNMLSTLELGSEGSTNWTIESIISGESASYQGKIVFFDLTRVVLPPIADYWERLTSQEGLIIFGKYPRRGLDVFRPELQRLAISLAEKLSPELGEYVGFHEDNDWVLLYLITSDARALYKYLLPELQQVSWSLGSYVMLYPDAHRLSGERFDLAEPKPVKKKKIKVDTIPEAMEEERFWDYIAAARKGKHDGVIETIVERLFSRLYPRSRQELLAFSLRLQQLLTQAFRWDIWGAAYLINGGASEDGFLYFRGWLILQGKEVYQNALADPDSLADIFNPDEPAECEGILIAADSIYQAKYGNNSPIPPLLEVTPVGNRWKEEELADLFPRLWQATLPE